jgi:hypothetical protein
MERFYLMQPDGEVNDNIRLKSEVSSQICGIKMIMRTSGGILGSGRKCTAVQEKRFQIFMH